MAKKNTKPKSKKEPTTISKKDYVLVKNYKCAMAAYEDPVGEGWIFSLELLTDTRKLIDIHGSRKYASFQDALLDCYGIVEYLGFSIESKMKAEIAVHHWDREKEIYNESKIYFDGLDFFKNEKKE